MLQVKVDLCMYRIGSSLLCYKYILYDYWYCPQLDPWMSCKQASSRKEGHRTMDGWQWWKDIRIISCSLCYMQCLSAYLLLLQLSSIGYQNTLNCLGQESEKQVRLIFLFLNFDFGWRSWSLFLYGCLWSCLNRIILIQFCNADICGGEFDCSFLGTKWHPNFRILVEPLSVLVKLYTKLLSSFENK